VEMIVVLYPADPQSILQSILPKLNPPNANGRNNKIPIQTPQYFWLLA
jgi:hypothetical protein